MRKILSGVVLVTLLAAATDQVQQRADKKNIVALGYVPPATVVNVFGQGISMLVADWAIIDTMFYYGTLVDPAFSKEEHVLIDYYNLYRHMLRSARLDPYNQDVYYFSQAIFTWEVGRINEVNDLLDYGMKYRSWDDQLPFFAGFNSFYFLKDYPKASDYMLEAYQRSGKELYARLASRFLRRSGRTEAAIAFLQDQISATKEPALKKRFLQRLKTFEMILSVERAVQAFERDEGHRPLSIDELLDGKYLQNAPRDALGRSIFLDENGSVQSRSGL
ncbi:hypothetical protein [uncultured Desulfuromonas sp.]|uniref:hypothetical protein n=1 Tax=uncultured Desulfuromonas sp. TaxID=181013 RepID=UPI002AAA67DD|nr:hypothetical protein [uncultured Desulfuromonas sp.]